MKYIKTFESLPIGQKLYNTKVKDVFTYFNKENRDKRSDIEKLKKTLINLVNKNHFRVNNDIYKSNKSSFKKGNTILNTYYGKMYIDILEDLSVNVYGSVGFHGRDMGKLPVKFNEVTGDFKVECCYDLESLEEFPIKVGGNLRIVDSGIESLVGLSTKEVGGYFKCDGNNLKTLEGIPDKIVGNIHAELNDIYTLDFLPKDFKFNKSIDLYLSPISKIHLNETNADGYGSLSELLLKNKDTYDLFMDYDPIRPPEKTRGFKPGKSPKPILYVDILKMFAESIGMEVDMGSIPNDYDIRTI
jgi:hypothetical protein